MGKILFPAGSWQFCSCPLIVIPSFYGDQCPDCYHWRCHSCYFLSGYSERISRAPKSTNATARPVSAIPDFTSDQYQESTNATAMPVPTLPYFTSEQYQESFGKDTYVKKDNTDHIAPLRSERTHLRATAKELPIYVGGVLTPNACADSGSDVNCISQKYADFLGAKYSSHEKSFDLPINRMRIKSIGRASIACHFPQLPHDPRTVDFFVFLKLSDKIIFGNQFLRETRTLDLYCHRLQALSLRDPLSARVRSLGQSSETIQCWLEGELIRSLPDTGANINMISLAFARRLKHHCFDTGIACKLSTKNPKPERIELANCSFVMTRGSLQLMLSFFAPENCNSSTHHLVDAKESQPTEHTSGILKPDSLISDTFHIVDGLRYDTILSETLLATVDAYNQHAQNFHSMQEESDPCIAIGRHKKKLESGKQPGSVRTEEDQLKDELSVESDRHRAELEDINGKLRCGTILQSEAKVLRTQANNGHLLWLTNHRVLLEKHFPGYYEKKCPPTFA